MFGIIYGIAKFIGIEWFESVLETEKKKSRQKAVSEGKDTYYDNRGQEWFIKSDGNDIQCIRWITKYKHDVLVDAKNMNIILKDYTKEKNVKEDNMFFEEYNKAMNKARLEGKKYFYVHGLTAIDKRYGYYELETNKAYELNKKINHYFKIYYEKTKNDLKIIETKSITENEFNEYGGFAAVPSEKRR